LGRFETLLEGSDTRVISVVGQASQMVLEEKIEAYQAFFLAAQSQGVSPFSDFDLETLCALLSKMTTWAEYHNRIRILRALKDVPIHFFGPVDPEIEGITDQSHHVFHGPTKGGDVLKILDETQILLNPVSVFPEGSHERIWFAMARGAAVYTDHSRFVAESYTDGKNILFADYTKLEGEADRIRHFLENPEILQDMVDKSREIYRRQHSWIHRLDETFRQIPDVVPFMPPKEEIVLPIEGV
ncbi:MAG: glycosyltransferase, partial [Alphaproteobacteria bacterium]|nr:glycosyltransferase [Alphaproteobacteria bacterium]